MTNFIAAIVLVGISFLGLGVSIIFFGRKNLGAECGTVPKPDEGKKACLSKEMGICPMEDHDGYLEMATRATRLDRFSRRQ